MIDLKHTKYTNPSILLYEKEFYNLSGIKDTLTEVLKVNFILFIWLRI